MRSLRLVLGLSLIALAATAPSAFAGKKDAGTTTATEEALPLIQLTGISEFDSVFSKALEIQKSLDTAHTELVTAQGHLNTDLGLANTAALKDALKSLNDTAGGKLAVAMKGSVPSLSAKDAVPENVQKGIDSANGLFETAGKTATTAKGLLPQSTELVTACVDFPSKVPSLVKDPMAAAKALKIVSQDLKTIKGTPDRINRLVSDVETMWNDVKAAFPS